MSDATLSSTEPTLVYVRLIGEGTTTFRPAKAEPIGPGTVRLLEPHDFDPDDEDWEFKPGSLVHVEQRALQGVEVWVAVSAAES